MSKALLFAVLLFQSEIPVTVRWLGDGTVIEVKAQGSSQLVSAALQEALRLTMPKMSCRWCKKSDWWSTQVDCVVQNKSVRCYRRKFNRREERQK